MLPENRHQHDMGWPRATQTSVAILGALAFGALAYGYGYGASGGRTGVYSQDAAAVGLDTIYPNRPTETTLIYHSPGTKTFQADGWTISSNPSGNGLGFWDSLVVATDTTSVSSPINAATVLQFTHMDSTSANAKGNANWSSYAGLAVLNPMNAANGGYASTTADTVYVSMHIYLDTADIQLHGQKVGPGYLGVNGVSAATLFLTWETNGNMRWQQQGGRSCDGSGTLATDPWLPRADAWNQLEVLYWAGSGAGTSDGGFRVWMNGSFVAEKTDLITGCDGSGPDFHAVQFYHNADAGPQPRHQYLVGDFYMSGND